MPQGYPPPSTLCVRPFECTWCVCVCGCVRTYTLGMCDCGWAGTQVGVDGRGVSVWVSVWAGVGECVGERVGVWAWVWVWVSGGVGLVAPHMCVLVIAFRVGASRDRHPSRCGARPSIPQGHARTHTHARDGCDSEPPLPVHCRAPRSLHFSLLHGHNPAKSKSESESDGKGVQVRKAPRHGTCPPPSHMSQRWCKAGRRRAGIVTLKTTRRGPGLLQHCCLRFVLNRQRRAGPESRPIHLADCRGGPMAGSEPPAAGCG